MLPESIGNVKGFSNSAIEKDMVLIRYSSCLKGVKDGSPNGFRVLRNKGLLVVKQENKIIKSFPFTIKGHVVALLLPVTKRKV